MENLAALHLVLSRLEEVVRENQDLKTKALGYAQNNRAIRRQTALELLASGNPKVAFCKALRNPDEGVGLMDASAEFDGSYIGRIHRSSKMMNRDVDE